MKRLSLCTGAFALILLAGNVSAQTQKSKEVRKEVNVEDQNGEKTLTIKTVIDGNETVEVYKGADADAKIKEFESEQTGTTKTMVIADDGKKHLKVETKVVIREDTDNDE